MALYYYDVKNEKNILCISKMLVLLHSLLRGKKNTSVSE